MEFKIIFETTVTNCGFKENCKITTHDYGLRIFLELLKPQSPTVVFLHSKKKKFHMDSYVDKKDCFDKYFGRSTILTIFFLQNDYFGLKTPICPYTLLQGQCLKQSSTKLHCSINVGFWGRS